MKQPAGLATVPASFFTQGSPLCVSSLSLWLWSNLTPFTLQKKKQSSESVQGLKLARSLQRNTALQSYNDPARYLSANRKALWPRQRFTQICSTVQSHCKKKIKFVVEWVGVFPAPRVLCIHENCVYLASVPSGPCFMWLGVICSKS